MSEIDIQSEHKNIGIEELEEPAYLRRGWLGFPWVFWGVVFLYGVSIILYGFKLGWVPSIAVADWGQFGDFFGGFINPIVGLVTIVLFAASLKQSQVAISHSEQALTQNEKILKATLEELKITRQTAEAGQAIQAATEKALKQQIEISVHEKHFNTVLALIEKYDNEIIKAQSSGLKRTDNKIVEAYKRHTFLSRYVDSNFSDVVEKAIESGFDPAVEFACSSLNCGGCTLELFAVESSNYVRIVNNTLFSHDESVFFWSDPTPAICEQKSYLAKVEYMLTSAKFAIEMLFNIEGGHRLESLAKVPGLSKTIPRNREL